MTSQPPTHEGVVGEVVDELLDVETALPMTTAHRIANQVAAGAAVLLGAGLVWGGVDLRLVAADGVPGPGLFPTAIGTLFVALGLVWFVLASLGRLDRSDDTRMPDRAGIRRILITAVATGVFLWALAWVGYPIAMSLYVLALLVFVGDRKWLSSVVIALVFGAGSYFAFTLGLGLRLPHSALPFIAQLGI